MILNQSELAIADLNKDQSNSLSSLFRKVETPDLLGAQSLGNKHLPTKPWVNEARAESFSTRRGRITTVSRQQDPVGGQDVSRTSQVGNKSYTNPRSDALGRVLPRPNVPAKELPSHPAANHVQDHRATILRP